MRVITADLLVAAVTELSKGTKLVRARDVFAWCDRLQVDCQAEGSKHQALWDADLEEAHGQRRLLKFKSGDSKQSRVGWALTAHGTQAREAAARLNWREQLWTGEAWEWLGGCAPRPQLERTRRTPSIPALASPRSDA
ncbi:hypothetical protein SAMN05443639_104107 [Stigmatella erecta]|uniref:Uncharacterized protein n=1 Tax=Stigmatella erecta TaxID=83460 RepID=A0A1I0GPM3_9BACT|nr:hypothetical protein SAMN05443639_104107 [Stigmatella erecta]